MKRRTLILIVTAVAIVAFGLTVFALTSKPKASTVSQHMPVAMESTETADSTIPTETASTESSSTTPSVAATSAAAAAAATTSKSKSGSSSSTTGKSTPSNPTGAATTPKPAPAAPITLSVAERQACYYDLIAAEDKAVAEADAKYPDNGESFDVSANLTLRFGLLDKYWAAVGTKYSLSAAQLDTILTEGISNSWPMPPLPK